jgi:hypothetical protein
LTVCISTDQSPAFGDGGLKKSRQDADISHRGRKDHKEFTGLHFNRSTPAFGDGGLKKSRQDEDISHRGRKDHKESTGLHFNHSTRPLATVT